MYIKQIIIQGFKSYKDQTVIEPFSPKNNVIVGRNGSGKSNFFAAIRFVLSDAYTQMGREERQALLHEGSGSAVMSAYVEIIFDNTDERFPTGKEELVLRRTIGMKKDEYSIDRKNATKADVMNLLESAGFSRSNPYYIVPQGRVTTLTNMKDGERLSLLKEVAGTHVYEARRAESIRLMTDTDSKREKIDESMAYIIDRLSELEEEKEELKAYQEKDRDRRCLEYTIYAREQEEINRALESLEEQRADGVEETDESRDRFLQGEKALTQIDEDMKALKQRMELLKLDKAQYDEERRTSAREKARAELEIKSVTEGSSAAQKSKAQHDKDMQEVSKSIKEREKQLSQVLPQYNKTREQERTAKAQLDDAEATRQRLYGKQGRSAKFKSKSERDTWLRKEIQDVGDALATRKAVTLETTEEITQMEQDIQTLNEEISKAQATIDNHGAGVQSMYTEIQKAKEARDKLMDQRKELWREEARLDSSVKNSQNEYDRAERSLSHMMDQNTSRGIAAVRRIKRQHNLEGVYGTLAELFDVSEKFKTAVEVTAGNSLFHYVVDTDDTATKVLEILNKEKAGRVTFMPLNRLHPKRINLPQQSDAIEMVSKLEFDEKYEAAFQQVFGKTIICPSLEVCAQYARSHGVSAITPGGDRSDKKGALTGGYHDPRNSRLDAVKTMTRWRNERDEQQQRGREIKHELEIKDQEITRAMSDLQKAESARAQFENGYIPMQQDLRNKTVERQNKQDAVEAKKRSQENVDATVKELMEQQSSYEAELSSEFKKALSKDEEHQLESLGASIPELRKQYSELSTKRTELESQKSQVEVELRESLRPRMAQLQSQEVESSGSGSSSRLKELNRELDKINKAVNRNAEQLKDTEQALDVATANMAELEKNKTNKQREQEETARTIERHQKRAEKSLAKRAVLKEKAGETAKNIAQLGTLPEAAFGTSYTRLSSEKAINRLHKVNESLKKYSHVNKKAFEQYSNFTNRRNELTKRRTELDTSQKSIRELIDVLDQRKDEAIERTFRQVSKEFASIFERLVPQGRGRLIIQRKSDRQAQGDDDESEEDEAPARGDGGGVENYTGVGISVSFNSRHNEQQRIQQLSGGQKSLCALALVFAIQQCDPAPFYLFDEIDANLDAQYRTAVAGLLQEISATGQFICTTFRPEMVHVADKCYGVTYSRKTSGIHVVGKDDALEFVESQVGGA